MLLFFPFPSHQPFPQPIPATLNPSSCPLPHPHPLQFGVAWGLLHLRRQLRGREKAGVIALGKPGFLTAAGFGGPSGSLKTYYFFFSLCDCCVGGVGAGAGEIPHPLPFPPPHLRPLPAHLGTAGPRGGETPAGYWAGAGQLSEGRRALERR